MFKIKLPLLYYIKSGKKTVHQRRINFKAGIRIVLGIDGTVSKSASFKLNEGEFLRKVRSENIS